MYTLELAKVIITIPCHNDALFIENAVYNVKKWITEIEENYLIIIAEDGSFDNSKEIASILAMKNQKIVHIHADSKLGRGRALMNAWERYDADIYAYIDCDLATDMRFFPELIKHIKDGYDLATGSRYIEGAVCCRPLLREVSSKVYNSIIRILFNDDVLDHQCGFKAFSRKMIDYLLEHHTFSDWFWDTEAIILANQSCFKIKEFPVFWKEKKGTRTPLKRLFNDVLIHGNGIVKLLLRARSSR
jgi:glycosyltransferase involved in cell wall biosynthesis